MQILNSCPKIQVVNHAILNLIKKVVNLNMLLNKVYQTECHHQKLDLKIWN